MRPPQNPITVSHGAHGDILQTLSMHVANLLYIPCKTYCSKLHFFQTGLHTVACNVGRKMEVDCDLTTSVHSPRHRLPIYFDLHVEKTPCDSSERPEEIREDEKGNNEESRARKAGKGWITEKGDGLPKNVNTKWTGRASHKTVRRSQASRKWLKCRLSNAGNDLNLVELSTSEVRRNTMRHEATKG